MVNHVLEIKDVSFSYPDGTRVLTNVSLALEQGRKTAFLGENGAGKSTLFLHFNGILKPESGTLIFDGKPVKYDKKSLLELRTKVGLVFQDPDTQLFSGDVYQEIAFGPLNLGLPESVVKERIETALKLIDITHLRNKPTHFLSYGEKKRVAIASVIAMEPEVIIFDEPTSFLDPRHSKETFQLLDRLNSEGKTIIISSHDIDEVYPWADSFVLLQNGEIAGRGGAEEVFSDSALLERTGLRQPIALELYQEMLRNEVIPPLPTIPRSKAALVKHFESAKQPSKTV